MKRETLRHPKTLDLAARLHAKRPAVLGYLTLLWDFTAEYAPQGNIGKFSDGTIAKACEWEEDPQYFVQALVEAKWLDLDTDHRLLIHDWPDHCERWVKAKLEKYALRFLEPTAEATVERSVEATVEPSPPRDQTKPILTKPNPDQTSTEPTDVGKVVAMTRKNKVPHPQVVVEIPSSLDSPEFRAEWEAWLQHRRETKKPLTPSAVVRQLKQLAEWGVERSCAAIDLSIKRNWNGIYEDDTQARTKSPARARVPGR